MLGNDDEDPGPAPDDDPESDYMKFHNCYGGSQWGYCLEKKGHEGLHLEDTEKRSLLDELGG